MPYRVACSLGLPYVVCSVAFAATCVFISAVAAVTAGASEVGEPARDGGIFTADAPDAQFLIGGLRSGVAPMGEAEVPTADPTKRSEVVFIDTGVADWQTLAEGVDPSVEVVLVGPEQDGVQVMADALAGRPGVEAVHVVGHGSEGAFQLGSIWVNAMDLNRYAEAFAAIRHSLAAGADLLLYGC